MTRLFLGGLWILLPSSLVGAQDGETVRLLVRPASAAVPALKHVLLPPLGDKSPGNAAIHYYKAFARDDMPHRNPFFAERLENWLQDPRQVPDKLLEPVLRHSILLDLDRGARREYCDWELTPRVRQEGINILLPDVQVMRELGNLVRLQARIERAEGKHEQSIRTLQTGFAMCRHLSESPTLISSLIGIAVANFLLAEVQELIQEPGAPNLYWALADMPQPFIDLRHAFQGDNMMLEGTFPILREKRDLPWTERQVHEVTELLHRLTRREEGPITKLDIAAQIVREYPAARDRLIARGHALSEVKAMPPIQVVFLDSVHEYERVRDEFQKWRGMPYPLALPGIRRVEEELKRSTDLVKGRSISLARILSPNTSRLVRASAKLDRNIAALRCIEAIRIHAAAHEGNLPNSLKDVTAVPVPNDPITGKPFDYQRIGDRAALTAGSPDGEAPSPASVLRYEITMKAK